MIRRALILLVMLLCGLAAFTAAERGDSLVLVACVVFTPSLLVVWLIEACTVHFEDDIL